MIDLPLAEWKQVCEAATPGVQTGDELYQDCPHITPDTRTWLDTFTPAVIQRLLAMVARQREALEKYGKHLEGCHWLRWECFTIKTAAYSHEMAKDMHRKCIGCDCGLTAAIVQDARPPEAG